MLIQLLRDIEAKERRSLPASIREAYEGGANKADCVSFLLRVCLLSLCSKSQQREAMVLNCRLSWHCYTLIYPDNPASLCPRLSDSSLWSCSSPCLCVWVCLWKCPQAGSLPVPGSEGVVYVPRLHKLQRGICSAIAQKKTTQRNGHLAKHHQPPPRGVISFISHCVRVCLRFCSCVLLYLTREMSRKRRSPTLH